MSKSIDNKRRLIIKSGLVAFTSILLTRKTFSDEISEIANFADDDSHNNEIIAVRVWPSSTYTRITVESLNSVKTTLKYVSGELILLIHDVELNSILEKMPDNVISEDPIISKVYVQGLNDKVEIKIKLKSAINYQTNLLQPVNLVGVNYQYRYVLDLYPNIDAKNNELDDDILALIQLNDIDSDENEKKALVNNTKPIKTNTNIVNDPAPVTIEKRVGSKSGFLIIMIDPGHGGEDPGAVGPSGLKEKDVVLDIGLKLKSLLDTNKQFKAYMTRQQDVFIPLQTRVSMARRVKADIFISIHADAFTNNKATGASVFVLSEKGSSSSFARWLAKTQNDSDLIGGVSFKTKDKTVHSVLLDMTQTYTKQNSIRFGNTLLKNMSAIGKLHKDSVEKANFAVLKAPDITSVLLETAFISNHNEEKLLSTIEYREKIAHTIFKSLNRMLG